jgi:rfaE bifunctional protein nucleotidyltransferase chain/domain
MTPRVCEAKILSRVAMKRERERLRAEGRVFVFTNGCFDILHAGHADYLAFARRQGDALAVGLNSDRSVRELKGPRRPIVPQDERARLLAALEAVDYVVLFDELHVDSLIAELMPDILVKGADRKDWVCGREIVERGGGRVVLAPVTENRSTTNIIAAVLEAHRPPG